MMFIREAKAIADNLVEMMSPFCDRIAIAGSIRRGCQIVKDIEIIAVPRWQMLPQRDLFDGLREESRNLLHVWATEEPDGAIVQWIKPGTKEIVPWLPKPEGKYWRGLVDNRIKLDLFLTTREQWGIIQLIRTGSAEFSQGVMTYIKHSTRYRVEDGALKDGAGVSVATPEEQDVFRLIELDYLEPDQREGFQAVRRNGQQVFPAGYGIKRMEAWR